MVGANRKWTSRRKWWHTGISQTILGESYGFQVKSGWPEGHPLHYDVPGDLWDCRTDDGKAELDEAEAEVDLMWTRWSPSRIPFEQLGSLGGR